MSDEKKVIDGKNRRIVATCRDCSWSRKSKWTSLLNWGEIWGQTRDHRETTLHSLDIIHELKLSAQKTKVKVGANE